jgi:low temperature requirement protein LtrA
MFVLMVLALMMAVSIHYAFSDCAWPFVVAHVCTALVRAFYLAHLMRNTQMGQDDWQLGMWSVLSGVFWIRGALIEPLRLPLWIMAVRIDDAGPYAGTYLPGHGTIPTESWTLKDLQLLERNQLIFIIALGESILLLGGPMVGAALTAPLFAVAAIGFALLMSMWWLSFGHSYAAGREAFHSAEDQTTLGRAGPRLRTWGYGLWRHRCN